MATSMATTPTTPPMRIISFDVGIKNMAYCFLDVMPTPSNIRILDWNVLNLMNGDGETELRICGLCTKTAKYKKDNECYCNKHAKASKYIIPSRTMTMTHARKLKRDDLITLCTQQLLFVDKDNRPIRDLTKTDIMNAFQHFLETKILETIQTPKKSASDTDLIIVGKNMKKVLDKIPNIDTVTHVVIENQISPIATRMKTIQGMLAQYFIMRGSADISIEFVSSSNKLKGLLTVSRPSSSSSKSEEAATATQKDKYKRNKREGIRHCSLFLENNLNFKEWEWTMNMTKKDDYADAFLQAIWYLKQKQKINYSISGENSYKLL